MNELGISKREIMEILDKKLKNDLSYESGHILGSMCTMPHEFAKEVYMKYIHKNLGDPGLFLGTYELERELISELGNLFGGNEITGSIVSGGTEANIVAMRIARKLRQDVKQPEIICSKNAHASFYKAADLMNITIREVNLNEDYLPDMEQYESFINKNTVALVGIAGTTSLGKVEPIEKMGKLAEKHNLFLHVDGAFGGFILPFMEELGYKFPKYDFRVKGVDSFTADPHKMGMGVIPSGGLLIRKESLNDKYSFSIPYLAGGNFKHISITGTRPGASAISFWALLKYLGKKGFKEITKKVLNTTQYLKKLIQEIEGIHVVCEPTVNILGIKVDPYIDNSICKVDEKLRRRGWALGVFKKLNLARIVVMPHINNEHAEEFAQTLEVIMKELRNK